VPPSVHPSYACVAVRSHPQAIGTDRRVADLGAESFVCKRVNPMLTIGSGYEPVVSEYKEAAGHAGAVELGAMDGVLRPGEQQDREFGGEHGAA
jgi:hypothetical protein